MSDIDFGPSEFLRTARLYAESHARARDFIEGIYADAHNLWANLEGNTAETDVAWFARVLYDAEDRPEGRRWDNAGDRERDKYLHLARLTVENLPRLMIRIANRCRHMADAAKLAIEMDRATRDGKP